MSGKELVSAVVGVSLILILIGFLLPVGFSAYHNESTSITKTLSETGGITEITPSISINLTSANAGANATIQLYYRGSLVSAKTINQDATGTWTTSGGVVTIVPAGITATTADCTISIPTDFDWSASESTMFGTFGILILVGLLIALVGIATNNL